jgi:hypothetical protein
LTRQGEVSLAALVWSVRQQLHEAKDLGKDDTLRFGVDSIELEVLVEATATDTKTVEGKAGANIKVLDLVGIELGGQGGVTWEAGRTSTAKVTVTITPRDISDPVGNPTGRAEIGGRDTQAPPVPGS